MPWVNEWSKITSLKFIRRFDQVLLSFLLVNVPPTIEGGLPALNIRRSLFYSKVRQLWNAYLLLDQMPFLHTKWPFPSRFLHSQRPQNPDRKHSAMLNPPALCWVLWYYVQWQLCIVSMCKHVYKIHITRSTLLDNVAGQLTMTIPTHLSTRHSTSKRVSNTIVDV